MDDNVALEQNDLFVAKIKTARFKLPVSDVVTYSSLALGVAITFMAFALSYTPVIKTGPAVTTGITGAANDPASKTPLVQTVQLRNNGTTGSTDTNKVAVNSSSPSASNPIANAPAQTAPANQNQATSPSTLPVVPPTSPIENNPNPITPPPAPNPPEPARPSLLQTVNNFIRSLTFSL